MNKLNDCQQWFIVRSGNKSLADEYSPLLRSEINRNNTMPWRGVFCFNQTPTPPSEEEDLLSRSTIRLESTKVAPIFLPFEVETSRRTDTLKTQPTPDTTETGSSYHTALHITEPFEHLFDEVLERRNQRNKEIDIKINSKTKTRLLLETARTLASESEEGSESEDKQPTKTTSIMEFEAPNAPAPTAKATELKLNQPKPFTGKRNKVDDFLQDVALYLKINDEIYNTDKKNIGYTLTFMNEGDAKSWKAQYIRNTITNTGINFGTWTNFITKVQDAFASYDAPGDALE